MKILTYHFIILALAGGALFANAAVFNTKQPADTGCWSCTSGTSYYSVPVFGRGKESVKNESLRVCRIIIDSWHKNPDECAFKSCRADSCNRIGGNPLPDDDFESGSECPCPRLSVCIRGRCQIPGIDF